MNKFCKAKRCLWNLQFLNNCRAQPPASSPTPTPTWGLRWFYYHIPPTTTTATTTATTTTTIQNSTFLSNNSNFLTFHGLKYNVQHIKIFLGPIPLQWNDFLYQIMSVSLTKLPLKFKFKQDKFIYWNVFNCFFFPR